MHIRIIVKEKEAINLRGPHGKGLGAWEGLEGGKGADKVT